MKTKFFTLVLALSTLTKKINNNFLLVLSIFIFVTACQKEVVQATNHTTNVQDSYSFLQSTKIFDAEFTSKFISFVDDKKLVISSDVPFDEVPKIGECIFCDRGELINACIGKVISISGTKSTDDYTIELTDASVEEVFEEIHIVQDFDLASAIRGAEDNEGNPIVYEKAEIEIWDVLTQIQLDSVERDTTAIDISKTKAGTNSALTSPLSFALNNDSFTGKLYGEMVFHPEIHYTKSTGLLYRMSWEQRFGFDGELHFGVKGKGEKPFGSIKIPLGQVCGIFTMLKIEPALFWEGENELKSSLRLEIDHSKHIITNGSGEVQHICTPLKKETTFNVVSLETRGKFGFKINVGVNAALFNENLLSIGVKAYPYVNVKANVTHFSINLPEILSIKATANLSSGIGADGYVTWMTPTGTKTKSLELVDIEIKIYTVNLLPEIHLRTIMKGNEAKIEAEAAKQSFIESPKGGISVWKGKDEPTVIKHCEIYASPASTKASENSSELEIMLEAGEVYYVAPYAEVDGQIIYGTMKELQIDLCPDENHAHAIDLGLSVKWACCNIGASCPEDFGSYFAWGETVEKSVYSETTYSYAHGKDTDNDMWYEQDIVYDYLGEDISGTQYDVAHVKWGGKWRMPTQAEVQELQNNCDIQSCYYINGVMGVLFSSRVSGYTDKSIFLPYAGMHYLDVFYDGGFHYWTSTFGDAPNHCYATSFDCYNTANEFWAYGLTVRPVSE